MISQSILETRLRQFQNLKHFNEILSQMLFTGFIKYTYAASRLVKFSTESPFISVNYSLQIFDQIQNPNGFIYNTLMKKHMERNSPKQALYLYKLMLKNNVYPDNHTYPVLVKASAVRLVEFEGKLIHSHVLKVGFDSDVYVQNTLINMYSVCGNVTDARKSFDESPVRDLVSWNSLLAAYVRVENMDEAKCIYDKMPLRNIIASNSMIKLFGQSGRVGEAQRLFEEMPDKDLVSWSAIISCFEQNGKPEAALVKFVEMIDSSIMADEVVIISVLSACAHLTAVFMGEEIHGLVVKIGTDSYVNLRNALINMYSNCAKIVAAEKLFNGGYLLDQISWNSMISGYMKCGSVEKAKALFDAMPEKDLVSWSTIISGFEQRGRFSETLAHFQAMQLDGVRPDEATLVSVISACAHSAALDQGKWVHSYLRKYGLKINVKLGTTLINMYMKCGCAENALEVFDGMPEKGVSSWNALILGLARNGLVKKSFHVYSEMKKFGTVPNEITFLAVLSACRQMGLVDEGRCHFRNMIEEYKIEPNVKHYGCMVDLLGRAGLLKEAEKLIEKMPMAPDVSTWGALLGACRKHGDYEMGERVGRKLVELEPNHDGFHVLLSNICASKGNWDSVLEIRGTMIDNGVVKTPGCSMIEANGRVHEFLAGDKAHPQINKIEKMLDEISSRLKMQGYAADTAAVPLDIDEEEKESNLFRHSEKLAIAFGLISLAPPTPIRIIKNLRICNDCHTMAKLVSSAYDREVVVRDRHLFHHFKHGSCSCMDYW